MKRMGMSIRHKWVNVYGKISGTIVNLSSYGSYILHMRKNKGTDRPPIGAFVCRYLQVESLTRFYDSICN